MGYLADEESASFAGLLNKAGGKPVVRWRKRKRRTIFRLKGKCRHLKELKYFLL
jgi:hypothetical protein